MRWRIGRELDRPVAAKRRVQLALVVLIILLGGLLATGVYSAFALYHSAETRYIHVLFPLRARSQDLTLQMVNEETGVRGYMISSDRKTLQPYFLGRTNVRVDLARISTLIAARPDLKALLGPIRAEIRALDGYFDRQITFVADGTLGTERARKDILGGQKLFNRFRVDAAAFEASITAFVDQTRSEERRTFERAIGLLGAGGLFALGIAIFLVRRVPERLRRLYADEERARIRAEQGANSARALAHVSDAVVMLDDASCILSWNTAAAELFGISAEAALGRPAGSVFPEFGVLIERSGGELTPVRIGGEERWLAISLSRFEGGRVVTFRDATAEHTLERARADFVTTASHELRTPLTAVYGSVRTLIEREHELDDGTRRRLLRMIEQESDHLAQIVDQLLVTAQIDRGGLRLDERECDVREICASVVEAAEARKPETIELALVAASDVGPIRCDPPRLRQVLVNLVENAIKYSPEGGRIQIRIADTPDRLRIEVHDEGLGIPPSEHGRIFEKFYRLDADMTRGVGGSGLGLYISREIVEQMGGLLSVRSHRGTGSTFTVTLPRAAGPARARPERLSQPA
ncbi:MAG: CHASE3 domain-containing protein [Acidobacteriota bacterium]|nr:CHASE3 domain-containing protein [Acidobacteriota bacterium]